MEERRRRIHPKLECHSSNFVNRGMLKQAGSYGREGMFVLASRHRRTARVQDDPPRALRTERINNLACRNSLEVARTVLEEEEALVGHPAHGSPPAVTIEMDDVPPLPRAHDA